MLTILEWSGAIAGALGALILACNRRWSGYGFVLFLFANAAWMGYGVKTATYGLVVMQMVCTGTSLLGIWRWLVLPRLSRPRRDDRALEPDDGMIPASFVRTRLAGALGRQGLAEDGNYGH